MDTTPSAWSILIVSVTSFLDSLCFGLLMPILADQILIFGGNCIILGTLTCSQTLLQCLASAYTRSLVDKYGYKVTFFIQHLIGILSHLLLEFCDVYWQIFIVRCIFYASNQSQALCKNILSQNNDNEVTKFSIFLELLDVFACIIGPIVGGHLFESKDGFLKICQLIVLSYSISALLCLVLKNDLNNSENSTTFTEKVTEDLTSFKRKISNSTLLNASDILIFSIFSTISLTAFFLKFTVLLYANLGSSFSEIGYIIAYQSLIVFIVSICSSIYRNVYIPNRVTRLNMLYLIAFVASMICVCYATTYQQYLIAFAVLAILQNIVQFMEKQCIEQYDDNDLIDSINTVRHVSKAFTQFSIGLAIYAFGVDAIKAFSVMPLVLAFSTLLFV